MFTIGTRGSALALAQANWVQGMILSRFPATQVALKIIKTSADQDTKTSIRSGSATGVFVKEIEDALLAGEIDLAVHSMKDLPTRIPDDLEIAAIPGREDPRDALVAGNDCRNLDSLPGGTVVGTGSIRRQAQLLALRPDLVTRDIRGNVGTRLQKLESGNYGAIILACAGLIRLGLQDRISQPMDLARMLPAPGQGALALEIRRGDDKAAAIVGPLNEPEIAAAVLAERAFLRRMGGGCNSPIAVHARSLNGETTIEGLVAMPDGTRVVRNSSRCVTAEAAGAAVSLAEKILSMGGAEILKSLP